MSNTASGRRAEPSVLAWDLDYARAAGFGRAGGPSGLPRSPPGRNEILVNAPLADTLAVRAGDPVSVWLYGRAYHYTVARVVADRGLAGTGFGASVNRNVFLPSGTLAAAAYAAHRQPRTVTFVSNRGGVEDGAHLTALVTSHIQGLLTGMPVAIDTPKQSVLDAARKTGDALGALFLMIGSFSIIAGAILLVNIFTMLADERKSQLGMLRAVGMKRARMVESFSLEGAVYAVAAVVPGMLLGLGVGWAVALVSAQIFGSWSANGTQLTITYAATPTSLLNGACLGLVIALATIVATSVRISRFNIIGAIRDLPPSPTARSRRLTLIVSSTLAVVLAVAAVPAVAASQAESTLLYPCLAATLCTPALSRIMRPRWAVSLVAAFVMLWAMTATFIRPHMFDKPSMAVFVIQGTLVAFSAVALISQNQSVVLRALRPVFNRPSEAGLALRLAVAYPLARKFRTGATLVMYTLITLVLVLLIEISGVINKSIDTNVADATAGYALRVDLNPATAQHTVQVLSRGRYANQVTSVVPLTSAPTLTSDPGRRTTALIRATAVGVPPGAADAMKLDSRLPGLASDAAAWGLVAADPRYVMVDRFYNASGGPNGNFYGPGDTFTLQDPGSGVTVTKTIAGIVTSALAFYPATGQATNTYPVIMSTDAARALFGSSAQVSSALLRTRAGVDPLQLAAQLQASYLSASLVATPIADHTRKMFSANIAFFRLMQGFLALGLLIGIAGLGVVMVRAVRERRRTIGVLRALGFQARTVRRSFLAESAFVAAEGVLLGSVLGVVTTWLMYQKSAAFNGVRSGFPVEWQIIAVTGALTLLASMLATIGPARRAARTLPAIAVRVAD
jgi:putative ABC transport system permease protein